MRRRELSGVLFGSAAGAMLLPKSSEAQSCTPPCYPQTQHEQYASVVPKNTQYPQLDLRRYYSGSGEATSAFVDAFKVTDLIGGEIFVPAGTWEITQALTIPFNTSLRGVGRLVSLIVIRGSFTGFSVVANVNSSATSQAHTRIEGIGFVGREGSNGYPTGALYFARVNWIVVRDCAFRDILSQAGFGIQLVHCYNWNIEHCYFENIMTVGVSLLSELTPNEGIVGCNHGVFGPNNDVIGNNRPGFVGLAVERSQSIVITGNNFEGSEAGHKAIDLNGSEGVWICGNYIERWTGAAIAANSGFANRRLYVMENVIHAQPDVPYVCSLHNPAQNNVNVVFALNRFADIRANQICVRVGSTENFCEFNNDPNLGGITEVHSLSCVTARALETDVMWTPGLIASGSVAAVHVNVPGAAVGDPCVASFGPLGANNVLISSHVVATDTVRVLLLNQESASVSYSAGTVRVKVFK